MVYDLLAKLSKSKNVYQQDIIQDKERLVSAMKIYQAIFAEAPKNTTNTL